MNFAQSWNALNDSVEKYNESLKDIAGSGQIQKITSSLHFIVFRVRYPGITHHLYIGRGKKFEGFFVFKENIDAKFRVIDKFLSYLRKYLTNARIKHIECFKQDRILTINYQSPEHKGNIAFFWKGNNLFFSNTYFENDNWYLFKSWNQKIVIVDKVDLEHFGEVSFANLPTEFFEKKEISYGNYDSYLKYLEDVYANSKQQKKIIKKVERKKNRIQADIQKIALWVELKKIIETPGCDLTSAESLIVGDIKIKFPKKFGHFQKVDLVYTKIKKLKKGFEILKKRLKDAGEESARVQSSTAFGPPHAPIAPVWKIEQIRKTDEKVPKLEIDLFRLGDIQIGAGLSVKGNDQLRSSWANAEDIWFHIEGYKSAHVVVKIREIEKLTEDKLKIVGSILKDYSGFKDELIPIIFTQVKNIKGVKGTPGKVIYKRIKFATIWYDKDWKLKCNLLQESKK